MLNELEAEQRHGKGGLDTVAIHRLVEQALDRIKVLEGLQGGCGATGSSAVMEAAPCAEEKASERKAAPASGGSAKQADSTSPAAQAGTRPAAA
eukprot:5580335-Prorocentrum_lima.AAC.1